MMTLKQVLSRISEFKAKILPDSVSPHYLGSILEAMLGYGWRTDDAGNYTFESVKVNSSLQVPELVFDRFSAIDTDTFLTESDVIESVTDNGDGSFTLQFREIYPGYFTSQIEHNILKGVFNDILQKSQPSGSGYVAEDPTVITSWMNVESVDTAANTAVVVLYKDSEISEDKNFVPVPGMKVMRVGNSGESSIPKYFMRQSCLYMSGSDGRIVKLFRVTKPIIDDGMMAASLGTLPEFLSQLDPRIAPGDDGVVADTVVARRFITVDSIGRPVSTTIDRGIWTPGEMYYDGSEPNDNGIYERSLVWHKGHGWLCNLTAVADSTNEPAWNSTAWSHAVGDTALKLAFNEVDAFVDIDDPQCPMSVSATYMGEDVTMSSAIRYDWERVSVRNGLEDTASDSYWSSNHRNAGPEQLLLADDLNMQFGKCPESLKITVTATLHDPGNPNITPQSAEYYLV